MKKTVILLLCFALVLPMLVSCGNDTEVPDGYKLASDPDYCKYSLYVPEIWISQSEKGDVTRAQVGGEDACNVSVTPIPSSAIKQATMQEYWQAQEELLRGEIADFEIADEDRLVSVTLGGLPAYRCIYTGTVLGVKRQWMQIYCPHSEFLGGSMIIFTYTAQADHYATHIDTVTDIIGYFKF